MNRNAETYRNMLPSVKRGRSAHLTPRKFSTTFNLGELRPIYAKIFYPGTSIKITENEFIRTQPLVAPPMDNINYETYWFKVRLDDLWKNFKYFVGESKNKWRDENADYRIPKIQAPEGGWSCKSIAADLGIRPGVDIKTNALFFRAYAAIINHWFRNTVIEDELNIEDDDTTVQGINQDDYDDVNGPALGGTYTCNRTVDTFSLCSIEPQRGPETVINLDMEGVVCGNGLALGVTDGTTSTGLGGYNTNAFTSFTGNLGKEVGETSSGTGLEAGLAYGVLTKEELGDHPEYSGLTTEIKGGVITINEMRNMFAVQKYFEAMSVYGNRMKEIIGALFAVETADKTLHKPEYIGGTKKPIQFFTSIKSGSTDAVSPQGNAASYSATSSSNYIGETFCDDYCIIMGVGVARIDRHIYSQGTLKQHMYDTFFDLFNPLFDSLGDSPVYNYEIFTQDEDELNPSTGKAYNNEVFGYNERFTEMRYGETVLSGELHPDYELMLPYTFADKYDSLPHLERAWSKEPKALLDRCLAVQGQDQFIADFDLEVYTVQPMSVHSRAGAVIA